MKIIEKIFGKVLEYILRIQWHHQSMSAVDESCLKVTGTTLTNGFDFIEAIERTDRSLAIGLQFHPEVSIAKHVNKAPNESNYMNYIQAQSIFRNFVNKAALRMSAANWREPTGFLPTYPGYHHLKKGSCIPATSL